MQKITVLYLIDTFRELAGAEKNLFDTVQGLNKERFKPIVGCFKGGRPVELLRAKGVEIEDLNIKRIYSPFILIKALKIFSLIKHRDVKIIVTYHESSDFLGCIIGKLAGVPVIISNRRDMGHRFKKRHRLFYRFINFFFDRIITVSEAVKNDIFSKEEALWYKLITIYNGVNVNDYSGSADYEKIKKGLGLEIDGKIVGIVAGLRPIKGHQYFLKAASLIVKEFPKAYFLIVGSYEMEKKYYLELKCLIRELKLEKNVFFTGEVSRTDEIISIMDICVMPSLNEGFSNAILEYMAAGKPVIATDTGGSPEAVLDGQTGILVEPCNHTMLASGILRLLKNTELAQEMGKRGKQRAEKLFSLSRMIKNIESLYDFLLEEKLYKAELESVLTTNVLRRLFFKIMKNFFAGVLCYSGISFLIKKTGSINKGIKILAYHRINNDDFDPLGMNVKVSDFERQIRYLSEHYRCIPLEQSLELLREGNKGIDDTVVITFDDGYRDNYTNAFSILQKYKVPASIFLSVEAIDKQSLLWFDMIVEAIRSTSKKYIDLRRFRLSEYKLDSRNKKYSAAKNIAGALKRLPKDYRTTIIDFLLKELDVKPENLRSCISMLSWDDVINMKDSYVTFGSHGLTHTILTLLSGEELEREILNSKNSIREKTGIETRVFAYPNGGLSDFSPKMGEVLKKYGYIAGCTLIKGPNNGSSDSYALRRFCVSSGFASGMFNRFSGPVFETETSGLKKYAGLF